MNGITGFLMRPLTAVVWTGLVFAITAGQWVGAGGPFPLIAGMALLFGMCGYYVGLTLTLARDHEIIEEIVEANHTLAEALEHVMETVQKMERPPPLDGTANIEEEKDV